MLKHIVLVKILQHLCKKDKPFDYIDTHAGAGLFDLSSEHAEKLQEHQNGIGKLKTSDWPELDDYFAAINIYNTDNKLEHYPGSPFIAKHFLRANDKAWLYELHPSDYELLKNNAGRDNRFKTYRADGFKGISAHLPPASRRALVLIDPAYEVKTDYQQVFNAVATAYKKFATGIYAIWYPVVQRARINELEKSFINSGIKNIQRFELGILPDAENSGMTASGMIVVNPPWMLMQDMMQLLPKLAAQLSTSEKTNYKNEVLTSE